MRGAVGVRGDGTSGSTVDRWFFRAGRDRSSNIILRGCLQSISVRERRHGFRGILRVHRSSTRGCVQQKKRLVSTPSALLHYLLPTRPDFLHGRVVEVDPHLKERFYVNKNSSRRIQPLIRCRFTAFTRDSLTKIDFNAKFQRFNAITRVLRSIGAYLQQTTEIKVNFDRNSL